MNGPGAERSRTVDLKLAKLALSQLSYSPELNRWAWEELNFRPPPYQGGALTGELQARFGEA